MRIQLAKTGDSDIGPMQSRSPLGTAVDTMSEPTAGSRRSCDQSLKSAWDRNASRPDNAGIISAKATTKSRKHKEHHEEHTPHISAHLPSPPRFSSFLRCSSPQFPHFSALLRTTPPFRASLLSSPVLLNSPPIFSALLQTSLLLSACLRAAPHLSTLPVDV